MNHDPIVDEIVDQLRRDSEAHWKERMSKFGVKRSWPHLVEETGGKPAVAMRHLARALEGQRLGSRVNPADGKPVGDAVIDRNLSTVTYGSPGLGKTTRRLVGSAMQAVAADQSVVLLTPQPKTVKDAYESCRLVSGRPVRLIDFGGRIISPESPALPTWDPTWECIDPSAARKLGRTLAGPTSPVAKDLGEGTGGGYWLMIPEKLLAAIANLVAAESHLRVDRLVARGVDPLEARQMSLPTTGLSGIDKVFDLLRPPAPPDPRREGTPFEGLSQDLSPELSPAQMEALRDSPRQMRELQRIVQKAAYNAARLPVSLQRIVFRRAMLEQKGARVDIPLVGTKLLELAPTLAQAERRQSNPLDQLQEFLKDTVPDQERRFLSPRRGDTLMSPSATVDHRGLTVLSYDSTISTGLAAGWFCQEVVDEAFQRSADSQAREALGGKGHFQGMRFVIDEGNVCRYVDLDKVLEEGRQGKIAVDFCGVSYDALVDILGEQRAKKVDASATIVVNFSPSHAQAEVASDAFGQAKEKQITDTYEGVGGGHSWQVKQEDKPAVPLDRLLNLKEGEALVTDKSDPQHRVSIVSLEAFYESGHPVGDVWKFAQEHGQPGPWSQLRPDIAAQLAAEQAQALSGPSEPDALPSVSDRPGSLLEVPDLVLASPGDTARQPAADLVEDVVDHPAKAGEEPASTLDHLAKAVPSGPGDAVEQPPTPDLDDDL